ncbi:netrin receptor DCC-like [Watersipora subatra]|uniref:netrin receptor DCC-like n=1 Tax=Watersipora subatra TaxID=2589382 RepID=UPI00355C5408
MQLSSAFKISRGVVKNKPPKLLKQTWVVLTLIKCFSHLRLSWARGKAQPIHLRNIRSGAAAEEAHPIFPGNITCMYEDTFDGTSNTRTVQLAIENVNPNCESPLTLNYKVNDSSYQSSAIFRGLKAVTTYSFIVNATNRAGNSSLATITVVTGEAKPVTGPRVEEPTTNISCVYVSWNPPSSQDANGEIIGYRAAQIEAISGQKYAIDSLKRVGHSNRFIMPTTKDSDTIRSGRIVKVLKPISKGITGRNVESQSLCSSILYYIIKVQHLNGSVIYQVTVLTSGNFVIPNLSGFTTYIVTVEVRLGDSLKSETSLMVLTVETEVPEKPHIENLTSTPTCMFINASKPLNPNGVIIKYLFACLTNKETVIDVPPTATHAATQLCGLPFLSSINCSVRAVNSIGTGEPVYVSGYTELQGNTATGKTSDWPKDRYATDRLMGQNQRKTEKYSSSS